MKLSCILSNLNNVTVIYKQFIFYEKIFTIMYVNSLVLLNWTSLNTSAELSSIALVQRNTNQP